MIKAESPALVCDGLVRRFGDNVAVDGVSFSVGAGETYGLLGPNGAGKSTVIRMICGLLRPDGGTVEVAGRPVDRAAIDAKSLIGFVPQDVALYPDLSALENLQFFGRLYRLRGRLLQSRIDEVLDIIDLADRARDRVESFSGGMRRRLNIGAGLLHHPKLLVLDEPTVGVDPQSRHAILESVHRLGESGMAVVYTTHYMEEAERVCDRVGIIDRGHLIAEGTRVELVAQLSEHDHVRLSASGNLERFAKECAELAGIESSGLVPGGLDLVATEGRRRLPAVIELAERCEVAVSSIDVDEPDLETVFLHLTGTALREQIVRVALVIAAKDLRQRFRDRSAWVLGFVAPVAIATLMSLAFQGSERFHASVGLFDGDHGAMSQAFRTMLSSPGLDKVLRVKRFASEAEVGRAMRSHGLDAAFVIPSGFTGAATGVSPEPIAVLTSVDRELAGQVATSVASAFVAQVNADRLSVATALAAGAPVGRLPSLAAEAASLRLPIQIRSAPSGDRTLKGVSYFGPGMGIFFLFFTISFTARGYFIERRDGTLERMAAAAGPGQILVGKSLSVFAYGTASLATMALFTSIVFDADWGGFGPAALLCVSMVIAVVALTTLVIALARSERQAEGFASIITFGLALLGGNFIFISAAPPLLRRLALFTPNGWALRAFVDLATGPHRLGVVALPVAAILLFAAVAGGAATVAFRRREVWA